MESRTFLLIDTSYLIFYRFHALKSWYRRAYPDQEINIDILTEKFPKLFNKCINELKNKFKVTFEDIIFCKDDLKSNLWRTKIYNDYKKGRVSDNLIYQFFNMSYKLLIPEFINKGSHMIYVPECESDDIMAILVKNIINKTRSNIILISNDNDFLQLINEKVNIINLSGQNLNKKIKYSPDIDLKIKIMLGDKSDNIRPVMKRLSHKKAFNILENEEHFKDLVLDNKEINDQYNLNQKLIDFSQIPENIKLKIEYKIKEIDIF